MSSSWVPGFPGGALNAFTGLKGSILNFPGARREKGAARGATRCHGYATSVVAVPILMVLLAKNGDFY